MTVANQGIAYTLTIRCQIDNRPGMLGSIATAIGENGGNIGAIDIVRVDRQHIVRDITVRVQDELHGDRIVRRIDALPGVVVTNVSDRVFSLHQGGKISIHSRTPLKSRDDLSLIYTPGVARVCRAIARDEENAFSLTIKKNSLAVISDGSAVLGLGNLGAAAAIPVMEGKAVLFKELADIDAFPICLKSQDPDVIVATVEQIAPVFGAVNLEDIAAPKCFDIEERLAERLDIPVMHDDQHGTAVVVLAGLRNAGMLVGKRFDQMRVVVNGIGAAGTAIVQNLLIAGVGEITAVDRMGILNIDEDQHLSPVHRQIAERTNRERRRGGLAEALIGADAFIGVSSGNVLTAEMVQSMGSDPIVFALANPIPEGDPEMLQHYARVIATGRSDFPNQINNALSFPGIFRGALDVRAAKITPGMRLAAAEGLASVISHEELTEEYIIPSIFNRDIVPAIAAAVARAARDEGVARADNGV
jgi:malate dehydrogenase (oxaloacetate-decarboxylating)